ncbi:unnamed protein product [Polarella glacialis]|uniref:Calpain catalytic domain-containing protein n=1 Tax=Polarella glacialis TaxID=89957 RepID=A0A813ED55_POLGL|nr:unnamed protein product [Polarella glacialis]
MLSPATKPRWLQGWLTLKTAAALTLVGCPWCTVAAETSALSPPGARFLQISSANTTIVQATTTTSATTAITTATIALSTHITTMPISTTTKLQSVESTQSETNSSNGTNSSTDTTSTDTGRITASETRGLVSAGIAFVSLLLVHVVWWPAGYRAHQLFTVLLPVLGDAGFAQCSPPIQWLLFGLPVLPPVFVAMSAMQVAADKWRVAALGSMVAFSGIAISLGVGRAATDSFRITATTACLLAVSGLSLAGFFVLFVWAIKPFSFIGTSVVLLCLSAVPSIALAFLTLPWRSTKSLRAVLMARDCVATTDYLGPATALPRSPCMRCTLVAGLLLLSVAVLGIYGFAVYGLHPDPSVRAVGFLLAAGVLILDALVWHLWRLGLVTGAAETALLMVAARVAACGWGERFWLIGHSGVFLAMGVLLGQVVVDLALPSPDSPHLRRQRLAAEMLKTLDEKTRSGLSSASIGGIGAPLPGDPAAVEPAPPVDSTSQKLKWWLHPAWIWLVLVICFAAEVGFVSFSTSISVPDISMCSNCAARPQQYYAGVAFGFALVYAVSILMLRSAQYRALGGGPLLEVAPASLVPAYLCWLGLAAYTSWVVDSWAVLVHVSFLPLIIGLFISGLQRLEADDFRLVWASMAISSAKVVPLPGADSSLGPDGASVSPSPEPPASGDEPVKAEARVRVSRLCFFAGMPWALRVWILSILLLFGYCGTLQGMLETNNRWIGWTIGAAIIVLSMTVLSNRLWFGTFRLLPEQPILWVVISLTLWIWAGLVWLLHRSLAMDNFAIGLLCVMVLYPAAYAAILGVQVLRDAGWMLKDDATRRFVRNAVVFSTVVYCLFLGLIAIWQWALATCGLSLLGIAITLFAALRFWLSRNLFLPEKYKYGLVMVVAFWILAAAVAITVYFQSIFGGFSALCCGVVLILLAVAISETLRNRRRTQIQQLRVISDHVFPLFRLADGGQLRTTHRDVALVLSALAVITIWGFIASAVLEDYPSVGMVVGVLALMSALVLMFDLASRGGSSRASVLDLPPAMVSAAAQEALSQSGSSVTDPSASNEAVVPAATARTTGEEVAATLKGFVEGLEKAEAAYQAQVDIACCGRFHTLPIVSQLYTLSAAVAWCRGGGGFCIVDQTPFKAREQQSQLQLCAREVYAATRAQQEFSARLQLCLLSAQAQQLWAKEAEFRAFLQSAQGILSSGGGGGTPGAAHLSLSLEDFQLLPERERGRIQAAWQKWRAADAKRAEVEKQRRKEEAEASRKRQEAQRCRREEARKALLAILAARPRDIALLQASVEDAELAGLTELDGEVAQAILSLRRLQEAQSLLEQAVAVSQFHDLQEAISRATVAGLKSEWLEKAQDEIVRIQGVLSAEEAEKRRKAEVERMRQLEEEAKRKLAEERERKRKEEEDRARKGQVQIIAADLDKLKNEVKTSQYTDKVFPPPKMGAKVSSYKIMRASEVCKTGVKLMVDGSDANDIKQGELGDCWFLSAVACIAGRKDLLKQLFSYTDEDKGLYVVRFYKNGKFQDVVVDDFFPTKYDRMAFASSGKDNETWVQVLEKAYAKLHGSYDAIEGGFVSDALVDLTGGLGEQIQLGDKVVQQKINDGTLWTRLKGLSNDGHLLGCGSSSGKDTDVSASGVVQGHAYSILRVEEVDGQRLMQLRNPWGSTEWKGKWSDDDTSSWTQRMQVKLGFVKADDGAFWIAFEDFVVHYRSVYICRVFGSEWNSRILALEWKGQTAGGCSNHATYKDNPQVQLKVQGRVRLLLSLEQSDERGSGGDEVPIGFRIFRGGAPDGGPDFGTSGLRGLGGTSTYSYSREVCVEEELAEGPTSHIIIPATFKPGQERKFTLKVFWKGDPNAVQLYQ